MKTNIFLLYFYINRNPEPPILSLIPEDQRKNITIINGSLDQLPSGVDYVIKPSDLQSLDPIPPPYILLPSLVEIKRSADARQLLSKIISESTDKKQNTTQELQPDIDLSTLKLNQVSYQKIILLLEKFKQKNINLNLHDLDLTIGTEGDIDYEELQFLLVLLSTFGESIFSMVKQNK